MLIIIIHTASRICVQQEGDGYRKHITNHLWYMQASSTRLRCGLLAVVHDRLLCMSSY